MTATTVELIIMIETEEEMETSAKFVFLGDVRALLEPEWVVLV